MTAAARSLLGLLLAPAAFAAMPYITSLAPPSGYGMSSTFTLTLSDADGHADVSMAQFLVNTSLAYPNGCVVHFERYTASGPALSLMNDAGNNWSARLVPGSAGSATNNRCTLSAAGSSVTVVSTTAVQVRIALTFKTAFVGAKETWGWVQDRGGATPQWVAIGNWLVRATNTAPVALSVTPSSGQGSSQLFTLNLQDGDGQADIREAILMVNTNFTFAAGCSVRVDRYRPPGSLLYLMNDAGNQWLGPVQVGSQTSLSNSRCTLSAAGSTLYLGGAGLQAGFSLTFKTAFDGDHLTYGYASDGGLGTWSALGTWSVGEPSDPPAESGCLAVGDAALVRLRDGRFDLPTASAADEYYFYAAAANNCEWTNRIFNSELTWNGAIHWRQSGVATSQGTTIAKVQEPAANGQGMMLRAGSWEPYAEFTFPGSTLGLRDSGRFTTLIYDPTPEITEIVPSSFAEDSVNVPVTIRGQHFGTSQPTLVVQAPLSCGTPLTYSPTEITTLCSAPATGDYDISVESNGTSSSGFVPAPGNGTRRRSAPRRVSVHPAPTVTISPNPVILSPIPGQPGAVQALLTATANTSGGSFRWYTLSRAFDNSEGLTFSPNANQHSTTARLLKPGRYSITVEYTSPAGLQAYEYVTLVLTEDVTVVPWVDGERIAEATLLNPDFMPNVNPEIINALSLSSNCGITALEWRRAGRAGDAADFSSITNDYDRRYANARLNSASGNQVLPNEIDPAELKQNPDRYRIYNRFQAAFDGSLGTIRALRVVHSATDMGLSLEPCSGIQINTLSPRAEFHVGHDAVLRITADLKMVYFVNEGRIGADGQAINRYLNKRDLETDVYNVPSSAGVSASTPYIWSAIQFDQEGQLLPFTSGRYGSTTQNLSQFPAFAIYKGTRKVWDFRQPDVEEFISLDSNYYHRRPE